MAWKMKLFLKLKTIKLKIKHCAELITGGSEIVLQSGQRIMCSRENGYVKIHNPVYINGEKHYFMKEMIDMGFNHCIVLFTF
jgi:RecB family endonuclease NucS